MASEDRCEHAVPSRLKTKCPSSYMGLHQSKEGGEGGLKMVQFASSLIEINLAIILFSLIKQLYLRGKKIIKV